jgi:membrane protease YdiL (CAAX protease family)
LGLLLLSDVFTTLMGRPIVPDFMVDVYQTAGFVPFLWLALIVAAPLMEEVFFRRFLLAGFSRSKIGAPGAIVLTAALWAAIHSQYDFYGIATIFVFGLFLGYARLKTGSIYTTIILHAVMNLGATIQVAALLRFLGDAG